MRGLIESAIRVKACLIGMLQFQRFPRHLALSLPIPRSPRPGRGGAIFLLPGGWKGVPFSNSETLPCGHVSPPFRQTSAALQGCRGLAGSKCCAASASGAQHSGGVGLNRSASGEPPASGAQHSGGVWAQPLDHTFIRLSGWTDGGVAERLGARRLL